MKWLMLSALAVLGTASRGATPGSFDAIRILRLHRAAVGAMPAAGVAHYDYRYEGVGLVGARTDRVDLSTGAFVTDTNAEGVGEGRGYDRRVPWQRDISGAFVDQQGGDRVPVAVNEAYRQANLWWRADLGGADIKVAPREAIDGRLADHLVVTPKGGKRFDAWFDDKTHLLVRVDEDQQFFHKKFHYGDHRRFGSVTLPGRTIIDHGVGESGNERLTLRSFSVSKAQPLATYARPRARPTGASIVGGAASATVPFLLLNNHIYVQAKVNGRGPFTFIVDTGGHTLLSPRLIAAVGLKPIGSAVMSGAGEKTATSGFVPFDEIAIGDVRLQKQIGFAAGIYDAEIEGIDVDGMVGFELFRRMVTEIDYGRETMTFTDPARFVAKNQGTPVPFVFYDHLPFVRGQIGGLPARLDIDTGSRSDLDATGPFVSKHRLRSVYPKGISAVTGWGVGGPSRSYVVRMPSIKLGTVDIEGALTGLSEDKGGSISDPNYDGNVGSGLLKRFVVTFDYDRQIMYLKRIIPTPADAGRFDRSGMWINAKPAGFEVVSLSEGGPAAKAGLAVGDIIVGIDGVKAEVAGLPEARRRLRTLSAGTTIHIERRRGDDVTTVALVLADAIG